MKVLAISNKIMVVNTDSSNTVMVKYGDDNAVFGINYPANVGFTQQLRLDLRIWKGKTVEQGKSYRGTNGVYQNNNVIIDKQFEMQTDYFDDRTHLALIIASKHKYFYIDGKRYFRNSDYDIEHNDEPGDTLQLAMAKATLIEQGKGFTNQAC
jgi:hypothetical protein